MTEEDEAFEDLAKRQGDWGMQGSRKHQIMRYAENVESKGTSMTQDEIDIMWQQAMRQSIEDGEMFTRYHFAKLVVAKAWVDGYREGVKAEREACIKLVEGLPAPDEYSITDKSMWDVTCIDCADAIRARGQE